MPMPASTQKPAASWMVTASSPCECKNTYDSDETTCLFDINKENSTAVCDTIINKEICLYTEFSLFHW